MHPGAYVGCNLQQQKFTRIIKFVLQGFRFRIYNSRNLQGLLNIPVMEFKNHIYNSRNLQGLLNSIVNTISISHLQQQKFTRIIKQNKLSVKRKYLQQQKFTRFIKSFCEAVSSIFNLQQQKFTRIIKSLKVAACVTIYNSRNLQELLNISYLTQQGSESTIVEIYKDLLNVVR